MKILNVLKRIAILTLGCSVTQFLALASQEDSEMIDLAPFVVTGEVYAFGSQKIVHISDKDLDRLQADSLSDIFDRDPSIMVGGGIAAAQKIYVRGIEDKMLNVSIDGATQAGYLSHHHGQYSIEPELLKYVEAEPGTGAATAGPGALAGAIRFQTKSASDFLSDGQTSGGLAKASFGTNGDQIKLTGALFGQLSERINAIAAYTFSDSEDYDDGDGRTIEYTGHETSRAFLGLDGIMDSRHSFGFSFEETSDEGTFRHRPNFYGEFPHPVAFNVPVFMDIGRKTATFDYNFLSDDQNLDLETTVFYSDFVIDRPTQYEMGYESKGLDIRNHSTLGSHSLAYGLNYRDDTASFVGKGSTNGFLPFPLVYETIPDETIDILGFFIQDDWQVSDKVQASFGLRWDEYDYTDKDGQNFTNSGFSPNAGISFSATDYFDLNLSYSAGFRGVTPIDLITANEGGVTNHASMDGEWSENVELGFQYDNGTYFVNGTVYQQDLNDVIVASGGRDNAGDVEVEGYDFAFGARQGNATASLGMSFSDPEFNGVPLTDGNVGLGTSSGRIWNANADYRFEDVNVTVGWSINLAEKYDEGTDPLFHKASYVVHDLYAQWVTGIDDNLVLTLTIDNAFDKAFVDQTTSGYNGQIGRVAGLPQPGRDVKLGASYRF